VAVFDVLTDRFVDAMFDSAFDLEAEFCPAYRAADTPLRLLLALVGACVTELRRLWHTNANDAAWRALRTIVRRMLDAQRQMTAARRASAYATNSELLCALEYKSILPSLAMLHIAHLGVAASAPAAAGGARALGAIFSRVDDLVDLLADCRRGVASTLAARVAGNVRTQSRSVAADADLYEVVDGAAGELVCLLESRAFAAHAGWAKDTDGLDALVAFARECVGGWVDWRDDAPVAPRARHVLPSARAAARAACDALIAQQRAGFHEAIHQLRLPRLDRRYETHAAAGWLRAIVLDALLDARDAGFAVPEAVLNAEALGILAAKHRHVRGGWNYLATVPELPPDADDNGQVLQVLARLGGAALAGSCEEPVRLHLDAAHPDGGVPTWTFDPWKATAEDEAVRRYLDVMGGAGVHPEVVANFACGLLLFDRARFEGPLRRIASFIEGVQKPDGSWSSRWYAGPYYGTFRAAAVLKAMLPRSSALTRSREFVIAAQRRDGGWGDPGSEPLSTALALLALDELGRSEHAAFTRGVDYLAAAREAAGGWPDIAWIRFPTTDGEVVYGRNSPRFPWKISRATL
jgi:hypothetical protein